MTEDWPVGEGVSRRISSRPQRRLQTAGGHSDYPKCGATASMAMMGFVFEDERRDGAGSVSRGSHFKTGTSR